MALESIMSKKITADPDIDVDLPSKRMKVECDEEAKYPTIASVSQKKKIKRSNLDPSDDSFSSKIAKIDDVDDVDDDDQQLEHKAQQSSPSPVESNKTMSFFSKLLYVRR